ncbi:MAG: hypothetical protein V2I74_11725 [Erythrobacter sp.]|jgi:hypothetical protein|nr:hypothetical protein [Erythrobacter sp.]
MSRGQDDAQTRNRYLVLNAVRVGGLAMLMLGLAIARGVIDAPYWLGVSLAVVGLLDFFFGPRLLARGWSSQGNTRR